MSGIIGYWGNKYSVFILIIGSKRLEYCGNNSAIFTVLKNNKLNYLKLIGKVKVLL